MSLNWDVKWSSRTPDSSSDRLIKTRPGRVDEDSERRIEEQPRSSSTNKSAKQEHLERDEKKVVRASEDE